MAEITLDSVSKIFGFNTIAVNKVSCTIADGEFFILLGPSGCGKSSLLNMIVGQETPTEGIIKMDGRVINDMSPKDRNMAMVFQSYALYPHMNVRQNMEFPLRMAGMDKKQMNRRVKQAATILELEELLDRMPKALSGGQRQRVAMGRAIVREPRVFLLDEPLSNLDAKLRGQMRAEISALQKKLGVTTIYVTHDQTEAMTLGNRLALLRKGRLQQIGTPRELYNSPGNLFTAEFIGSPAMNFLPATVGDGCLRLPMLEIPLAELGHSENVPAKNCIVGIRPEHIFTARENLPSPHVFKAQADSIEWLGADAYVHFRIAAGSTLGTVSTTAFLTRKVMKDGSLVITARVDPALKITRGAVITLGINVDKIHLFDPDSGNRL